MSASMAKVEYLSFITKKNDITENGFIDIKESKVKNVQ